MSEDREVTYAGFWVRFMALIFDEIIIGAMSLFFTFLFFGSNLFTDGGAILFSILFNVTTIILFWTFGNGATPGKKIMGIRIVSYPDFGRVTVATAILRYLGYSISALFLCLGFLMIGFRKDKRGMHDLIAGTCVIHNTKEV